MTLIVALKAVEGIVLATDSRGTIGDPRGLTAINDTQEKLFQLGKCGIAFSGGSEVGAALLDEFRKKGANELKSVDNAVDQLAPQAADLYAQWFREIPAQQRAGVLLLLAGYRYSDDSPPEKIIYLLNSQMNFAPQLCGNTMLAGVPQYAVYLLHRYYNKNITVAKAVALAEYLIAETASQDPKVGGAIKISVVTPRGYREVTEKQVLAAHKKNEALNTQLQKFFA